ncbi:MAG: hypothetical protein AB7E32_04760 [Desulfovibrio sp.]|jgi:hypothetical protein|uniref:hypothetical protein n=1 Tax=Paucidesulfovibrio longus TaxID=889 RepID=UPI0003B516F9|nr:hypothetical protein [Paucidesulfovibrio longus]
MAESKKTVTVTGILYPVYDGDYENISGVVLSGIDESEYLVVSDKYIDDLVNLCQEEVSLRGKVGSQNGMKTIEVQEYRIVSRYYDDVVGGEDDEYMTYLD